jgi:hypothetical protein
MKKNINGLTFYPLGAPPLNDMIKMMGPWSSNALLAADDLAREFGIILREGCVGANIMGELNEGISINVIDLNGPRNEVAVQIMRNYEVLQAGIALHKGRSLYTLFKGKEPSSPNPMIHFSLCD